MAQSIARYYQPAEIGSCYVYAFEGVCSATETFNPQGIQDKIVFEYTFVDNQVCYIGEGQGNRINRDTDRKILPPTSARHILKDGLSQSDAYALERILIKSFGRLCNSTGVLANLDAGGLGSPENYKTELNKIQASAALLAGVLAHSMQVVACDLSKNIVAKGSVAEVASSLEITKQQVYGCLSKGSHGAICPKSGIQLCFSSADEFESFTPKRMRNTPRESIRSKLIAVYNDGIEVMRGTSAEISNKLELHKNGILHRLARKDVGKCYGLTAEYL